MKTEKYEFRTIWYLSVGARTENDSQVTIVIHKNIRFNTVFSYVDSPLHPFDYSIRSYSGTCNIKNRMKCV